MTNWTLWNPGAGSMGDVDNMALAFGEWGRRFESASGRMAVAVTGAGLMHSGAVTAWSNAAAGQKSAMLVAKQGLMQLMNAFGTYSTNVVRVRAQVSAAHDLLRSDAYRAVMVVLEGHSGTSGASVTDLADRVKAVMDVDTVPAGVVSAIDELVTAATQRMAADQFFVSDLSRILNSVGTLFGVVPNLPYVYPGGGPPPVHVPPAQPPKVDTPDHREDINGTYVLGQVVNAGGEVTQAASGAWQDGTTLITNIHYGAGKGAQFADAMGGSFGAMGSGLSLWGDGMDVYDWATGKDPGLSAGDKTAIVANTVSDGLGLAAGAIQYGSAVSSLAADAASVVAKSGSKLVPGLGIAAGVAAVVADGAAAWDALHSGDTGQVVGAGLTLVGDLASTIGTMVPPPIGLAVSAAGIGVSIVGSIISHFW